MNPAGPYPGGSTIAGFFYGVRLAKLCIGLLSTFAQIPDSRALRFATIPRAIMKIRSPASTTGVSRAAQMAPEMGDWTSERERAEGVDDDADPVTSGHARQQACLDLQKSSDRSE